MALSGTRFRMSGGAAVVGPPKGGSATALSGTVFRVSERAAVVIPPEGGSATALSGTMLRVSLLETCPAHAQ